MKISTSETGLSMSPRSAVLLREESEKEESFRIFVERSSARALRVAWRLVGGDGTEAEEVVQEAFLAAWKALPRFRSEATLDTWFFRILVRRAHNHRRWRSIRTLWTDPRNNEPEDPESERQTDPLLRSRINKALSQLSQRQREVFVLVHMDGFTLRETADILGLRPGSIKSHLHRALCRLRTELNDLVTKRPSSTVETPGVQK
ncbi:RNA polymerase sigma factor [Myxococcota bacterium]|nr:RNA polymerase sigma factor [Myxococcota bacterium]